MQKIIDLKQVNIYLRGIKGISLTGAFDSSFLVEREGLM